MYINRILDLDTILKSKSCFLFGPRQTGKSSLIRETLQQHKAYNLLDSDTFLTLSQNLKLIEQQLTPKDHIIIIDEIQKLPQLLDEVHLIIEKYNIHFLLTGSSARKLRQGGVNLLGGRARSRHLHPFIYKELQPSFQLHRALEFGLIPSIYMSDSPQEDLAAYAGDYLKEEIASEALVRNIPAFSRFLQVAACCNSQLINFSKISNDAQVPSSTIQEYFGILKDTLVAFELPPWKQTIKRKPISTSKCYFFDIGITRFLQKRGQLNMKSPEIGEAFETYIAHELKTYCDHYGQRDLHFWRSKTGQEVDFILNNSIAIEVKAKSTISKRDLTGLRALKEEKNLNAYWLFCFEKEPRVVDGIHIYPWNIGLDQVWEL